MRVKDNSLVNRQDAEIICAKIREEAEYQYREILQKARNEAEEIIQQARRQAESQREELFNALKKELAKAEEKIISMFNLEKKRIILEGKRAFVEDVMDAVKKEAEAFRNSVEYPDFLKKVIMEGLSVIDDENIDVIYSQIDSRFINDAFINEVTLLARDRFHPGVNIKFQKGDFKDIGIIMQSQDGRRIYDNRFSARLKRVYEDVYAQLLKEAF